MQTIAHEYMLQGLALKVGIKKESLNDNYNGSDLMQRLERNAQNSRFSYNEAIPVKFVYVAYPDSCHLDNDNLVTYLNSVSQQIADAKKTQAYKPECMTLADTLEWVKILLFERPNMPEDKIDYAQVGCLHTPPKKWENLETEPLVDWYQTLIEETLFRIICWKACVSLQLHCKSKRKTQTSQ